jgi:hypothetical protein
MVTALNLYGAQLGTALNALADEHPTLPIFDLDIPREAIIWGYQQCISATDLATAAVESAFPVPGKEPSASLVKARRFFGGAK